MSSNDPTYDFEHYSEATRELLGQLLDPDREVRSLALQELVGEVDDELAEGLLQILKADGEEELRGAVAIVLGPTLEMCDDELDEEGSLHEGDSPLLAPPLSPATYGRLTEELRRLYCDAGVPRLVRRRVLEAAVRSPKPWQEGAVRAAWSSDDEDWRATAVFCMGFLYGIDFSQEIESALRGDSEELRSEAIRAAGQRGLEALGPEIRRIALDSEAPAAERCAAVESLPYLEVADASEVLNRLTESGDETLARLAEEALDELLLSHMADSLEANLDYDSVN